MRAWTPKQAMLPALAVLLCVLTLSVQVGRSLGVDQMLRPGAVPNISPGPARAPDLCRLLASDLRTSVFDQPTVSGRTLDADRAECLWTDTTTRARLLVAVTVEPSSGQARDLLAREVRSLREGPAQEQRLEAIAGDGLQISGSDVGQVRARSGAVLIRIDLHGRPDEDPRSTVRSLTLSLIKGLHERTA